MPGDAAIANELWESDEDGGEAGRTTARAIGFSQQDDDGHPAILPDLKQAQREAIARQESEDFLFGIPHTMEEVDKRRSPAWVAAQFNQRATKPSKIAKHH